MLAGTPDTVRRFLHRQVNIHGRRIGPTEEILPLLEGVLDSWRCPADQPQVGSDWAASHGRQPTGINLLAEFFQARVDGGELALQPQLLCPPSIAVFLQPIGVHQS
jgi:hypothetical protein